MLHEHWLEKEPTMTKLSGNQISQLTAVVTGGGYKRANSKESAIKRLLAVLAERVGETAAESAKNDILNADDIDAAKEAVTAALRLWKKADAVTSECAAKSKTGATKAASATAKPKDTAKTAANKPKDGKSKTAQAADLIRRKGGATREDILALTGWPAVSVPAVAKSAGIVLRKEKEGRAIRYFAKAS